MFNQGKQEQVNTIINKTSKEIIKQLETVLNKLVEPMNDFDDQLIAVRKDISEIKETLIEVKNEIKKANEKSQEA